MKQIFAKYNIPTDVQYYIFIFLQEKTNYDLVVKELPLGIHRSYVKGEPNNWQAYDIFKKQFKKYSIVVKQSNLYKLTELTEVGLSQSCPLYYCKLCKRYHRVFENGKKYCIRSNRIFI